jgi:dTDP-4-amino-4,6-dideoxy-D-galactose acyltransferase
MRAAWIDRYSSCEAGPVVSAPIAPAEDSGFELLPWDSERFGFPVARVRSAAPPEMLAAIADEMRRRGVVLAYYGRSDERTGISDQDAASIGARLVDTRIVFRKDLESSTAQKFAEMPRGSGHRTDEKSATLEMRSFREQAVGTELIELARGAGRYSRFRVDPRIDREVFHAIYDAWLIRSVRREIADDVFVGSVEGNDVGLVTVSATQAGALIGLLAIGDSARGRGFGRALIEHAFEWAVKRGCRALRVATQLANEAACALYASVGCSVESRERTYHLWLA